MNPILLFGLAFLLLRPGKKKGEKMISPVSGKISSHFGNRQNPVTGKEEFHNGIDIAVPVGTPVHSPGTGEVLKVFTNDAGGLQIAIKHANGYYTGFAHLSKANVKKGDKVKRNEVIALSGKSGNVTGAHLHFAVRDRDLNPIDPEKHFDF